MFKVHFDSSLPVFASLVQSEWGEKSLQDNFFLRDFSGRLTFIVLDETKSIEVRADLAQKAVAILGCYVDAAGFAVSTPDELFDDRLSEIQHAREVDIVTPEFAGTVKFIDRRLVGGDWLRSPVASAKPPHRIVFSSIKGGVGRSTALCVLAEHLASKGKRVLAVDMDIEAPGLGNMLLPIGTLPEFGLLDYLVEQNFGELEDQFYVDIIGSSWLGRGRGRVDVLPAIGQQSLDNPANVLAKIARAYLPGGDSAGIAPETGELPSFMDHMMHLIDRLADPLRYDVILIDSRAGLHETTAAAIVGLGAHVLFFGLDQPQTFAGYELLLAHLGTLPVLPDNDWRERFSFVQAKAPASKRLQEKFATSMTNLLKQYLWKSPIELEAPPDLATLQDTFEVDWNEELVELTAVDEPEPANYVLAVLDNDRYHSFNPLEDREVLDLGVYGESFGELLEKVTQMLEDPSIEESNE